MRFFNISRSIDIGVTHAGEMLNHRNGGGARDGADQFLSAARNDDINIAILLEEKGDGLSIGRADQLDRPVRQARFVKAWVSTSTMALLVANASDPPFSTTALPALRHRPAASAVTFGRDS